MRNNNKIILTILILLCTTIIWSQNIGINSTGALPEASAMLDVSSTNKGMLIPRMTTVQREAINTPAQGLLVYDISTHSFWYKSADTWIELVSENNNVSDSYVFTGISAGYQILLGHQKKIDEQPLISHFDGELSSFTFALPISSSIINDGRIYIVKPIEPYIFPDKADLFPDHPQVMATIVFSGTFSNLIGIASLQVSFKESKSFLNSLGHSFSVTWIEGPAGNSFSKGETIALCSSVGSSLVMDNGPTFGLNGSNFGLFMIEK